MGYKLEFLEKAAKLEKSEKWQEMLTFCKGWAAEEPQNLSAWQGIGDSLRKLGKPAEAIPMYRKGLDVSLSYRADTGGIFSAGPLWYRLGHAFSDLGDHHKAIEAFLEAAKIDPDVADIWNDLGVVYINMTPREVQAAYDAFSKAISVDPKNTNSLKNLGVVYAMCGSEKGVNQIHQMLSNIGKNEANDFLRQAKGILASH